MANPTSLERARGALHSPKGRCDDKQTFPYWACEVDPFLDLLVNVGSESNPKPSRKQYIRFSLPSSYARIEHLIQESFPKAMARLWDFKNLQKDCFPHLLSLSNNDSNLVVASKNAYTRWGCSSFSSTSGGSLMKVQRFIASQRLSSFPTSRHILMKLDHLLEQEMDESASFNKESHCPSKGVRVGECSRNNWLRYEWDCHSRSLFENPRPLKEVECYGFLANTKGAGVTPGANIGSDLDYRVLI
ncbi:hypothetical protein Tco_0097211 [Tanacetum coccineum]